jgi:hypothetical protein
MELIQEEVSFEQGKIKASFLETKNAVITLFYEEDPKLGALALALPNPQHPEIITSSLILGDRNSLISRVLAENLSKEYGKIAIVSTSFNIEEDLVKESLGKLLKKIISRHTTEETRDVDL